jgi:hypothetical protein
MIGGMSLLWHQYGHASPFPAPSSFLSDLQAFLAPNSSDPFDIDLPSHPLQQGVNAAITKAGIFVCQSPDFSL